MAALAHGQVEGRLGRGVVQEDGVAVAQLELHIAEGGRRSGALDDRAVRDIHVVGRQIAGTLGQDLVPGDRGRHIPGRVGHHGGELLLEAGRLVGRRADHDPVRVHRLAVLPVDHDGGGGVDLDPLGGEVALEPAAAFEVQGDLAGAILSRGRQRPLRARADPAVGAEPVANLEALDGLFQLRAVDIPLGRQPGPVRGRQVALGDEPFDQHRNARIARAGLDRRPGPEGGPAAALADHPAIAHIAGREV